MPVTVDWDNPNQTTLCYTFRGRWTWDDFHAIVDESETFWESVSHPVDIIVDVAETDLPPGDPLPHLQMLQEKYRKPNVGHTVIIGVRGIFRVLADAFVSLFNQTAAGKFFFADSIEEARTILQDQRE